MKHTILATAAFLLALNFEIAAQTVYGVNTNIRATNTIDGLADQGLSNGELLYGIPVPEPEVKGDTYFSTEWMKSRINLYESEKVVQGYEARYNLNGNQLEFRSKDGTVRAADKKKVKSFALIGQDGKTYHFVNGSDFLLDGVRLDSYLQVISIGKLSLLKNSSLIIKDPTYRPEFAIGEPDYKIVKKATYFLVSGEVMTPLNVKNKKKFIYAFGEKKSEVASFIKTNQLQITNDLHLALIIDTINNTNK